MIELERQLKINEDVLRYITVKVDQFDVSSNKRRREDRTDKPEGETHRRGDRTMSYGGNVKAAAAIATAAGIVKADAAATATRRAGPSSAARRPDPFSGANAPKIDYKDVKLLQRFISERGKIVPSRITAVSNKKQRHSGERHQARALHGAAALRREVRPPCK